MGGTQAIARISKEACKLDFLRRIGYNRDKKKRYFWQGHQFVMQNEEFRNYWHSGINLLLQGDESAAQDIWISALLGGTVEEVESWTKELVQLLEVNSIEQLQFGNYTIAKKCYLVAREIDSNYKNDVLDAILLWQERYLENCQTRNYKFTTDWFSYNIPVWQQVFKKFAHLPDLNFLEIGSWEGRTACWMLENVLTDESSKITCIDTFKGSVEHQDFADEFLDSLGSIFDYNIKQTGKTNQVNKLIGTSQEILRQLNLNTYDFLYVDGSHIAPDVLEDALLGWRLIKVGGIIIFDDYEWGEFADTPTYHPKLAVNAFLNVFQDKIKLLYQGYQVVVEKTAN